MTQVLMTWIQGMVMLLVAGPAIAPPASRTSTARAIQASGRHRTFVLHVPASLRAGVPAPLVFVLHGVGAPAGGSSG